MDKKTRPHPKQLNKPRRCDDLEDYANQVNRERGMIANGVKAYRKSQGKLAAKGRGDLTSAGQRFLNEIMELLVPKVKELQQEALKMLGTNGVPEKWAPLVCLGPETMACLTAWRVFAYRHASDPDDGGYSTSTPRPVLRVALDVAKQIVRERRFDKWVTEERKKERAAKNRNKPSCDVRSLRNVVQEVDYWIGKNVSRRRNHDQRLTRISNVEKAMDGPGYDLAASGGSNKAAAMLLSTLVEACPDYFKSDQGSCFTLVDRLSTFKEQHIVLTRKAQKILDDCGDSLARPILTPMLCPPRAWMEDKAGNGYRGGYCNMRDLPLVSTWSRRAHKGGDDLRGDSETPKAGIVGGETLKAVNAVQATAWRINRRVAEILCGVINSEHRECLGLGPPERLQIPGRPSSHKLKEMSPTKRAKRHRKRRTGLKANSRLQTTIRLRAAIEADEDQEAIWFPHFLDFRGRMYPYPQDLHPQASKPVRACLQFAEGKPLGSGGGIWLKRQLPASYGGEIAKASLNDQIEWVDENKRRILKLARNPLKNIEFWKLANDPWRFLAACCEWAELDRTGKKFVSHLPVVMDGKCNGLQHLAALAGDPVLGALVCITPPKENSPQDVYQEIANAVREAVHDDAKAKRNNSHASAWLAKDLITRNTLKSPVMTFPYGVTSGGLYKQILKDDAVYKIRGGDLAKDAGYLAKTIRKVTNKKKGVLSKAKAIKDWLSGIAREFAREQRPMVWTNPAGMDVRLEKYWIKKSPRIRLNLPRGKKVSIAYRKVDRVKGLDAEAQARGITASVVHSFDAAHLAKTVNACSRAGIRSFAVVHDSYGTHARDAAAMAKLLREQFQEIYSQPWLEKLAEQWQEDAPDGVEVRTPPARGDLDITQVTKSEHFFC